MSMVPLDDVFEMLGRIREQVHSRLSHLCEDGGVYLNVKHVEFQKDALDSVLDDETIMIGQAAGQSDD
jgi:hypothetical protein